MAVMKDKRHYLSACTVNDEYIYAFGGFFGSTEQEINDTIEVYEVEKNTWVVLTVRMKVSWTIFINLILCRTLCGLAVPYPFPQLKSFWLVVKIRTEMEKSICLMSIARRGNPFIRWTNYVSRTKVSSSKTKSAWLVVTTIWVAKCTTSKKTNGVSYRATTPF